MRLINSVYFPQTYDAMALYSTSGFGDKGEEEQDQGFLQATAHQSIPTHHH